MPIPVDSRGPGATYASKDNIEPITPPQAGTTPPVLYVEGVDAATGASSVVTVDTPVSGSPAVAADTGQLGVGDYAYYAEITHPGAAAANRQVDIQHRDAANAANIGAYGTVLAGSGKRIQRGQFRVETANERLRLVTSTDATNALISVKLVVWKVE